MPLTFGAATSNNVALSLVNNVGATGTGFFFGGWFYPTTLTAGRCYLSFVGSNPAFSYSMKVATTTSALQLGSNTGTTAGVWSATADSTLFPSGITTNNWWFIAGFMSVVTGPTVAWRMWLGDASTAPTAMTVLQTTAPVGALGATTSLCIGNDRLTAASPTASFQGDVGMVNVLTGTTGVNTLLPIATPGSVSTDEQALIEQTYVQRLWSGRSLTRYPRDGATNSDWLIGEFRDAATYSRVSLSTATQVVFRGVGTTSGATSSLRLEPTVSDISANVRLPLVRR